MFDQSFSVENFRRIFDYENRKGINLDGKYFPSIKEISEDLKEIQSKLKDLRRQKSKDSSYEKQKITE
jgi:hypothetical protein